MVLYKVLWLCHATSLSQNRGNFSQWTQIHLLIISLLWALKAKVYAGNEMREESEQTTDWSENVNIRKWTISAQVKSCRKNSSAVPSMAQTWWRNSTRMWNVIVTHHSPMFLFLSIFIIASLFLREGKKVELHRFNRWPSCYAALKKHQLLFIALKFDIFRQISWKFLSQNKKMCECPGSSGLGDRTFPI